MKLDKLISLIKENDNFIDLSNKLSKEKPYKINCSNIGIKSLFLSPLFKEDKAFLIIVNSKEEEIFLSTFFDLIDYKEYGIFPTLELSPYESTLTDINIISKQYEIIENIINKRIKCIITRTKSLFQKISINNSFIKIRKNQIISPKELVKELIRLGYKEADSIEERGQFSKKGSYIQIYPSGHNDILKIDFFDDEIEYIYRYDTNTRKNLESFDFIDIYSTHKFALPKNINSELIRKSVMEQVIELVSKKLEKNADILRKKVEKDLENMSNYTYNENTSLYLNFFYNEYKSIIDFLPQNSFIIWSEFTSSNSVLKKFEEDINKSFNERVKLGSLLKDTGKLYIPLDETLKKSRNHNQIRFSSLNDMPNINIQFSSTNIPSFSDKFNELIEYIKNSKNKKVFIVTQQPQRALTILNEKDCNANYIDNIDFDIKKFNGIFVIKGSLLKGFVYNDLDLIFITDSELFGWSEKQLKRKKENKNIGQKINKVDDIKNEDFVIHQIHGIGQYKGLRVVEIQGLKKEYFEIIYAREDKLLVPIEQINLLSLYKGSGDNPPKLSKMGGIDWKNLKNKVRDSVKQLAFDLISLYAKRKSAKGFAFPVDNEWQKQMEDTFPYDETPDQLKAILEVKKDMEAIKPMDRLICGDVGFGKTEVAIRAVFKSIMAGKQVAVISPTTVLSQQLFDVMYKRFAPYPIKSALLNRFRTASETKKIYDDIKKGNIDLIVSTHKVLMKTPEFFDLGLLIIDEEHKFGVGHKEKIKNLKENIDVLTMSATPIPRTLYMSLSGIREISLIETPPSNRFVVKTKLFHFDLETIKNAILYEIERGGQVYFVHNRVESLAIRLEQLKELLPNINIGLAHGQLPEHELENVMLEFNNKNIDVLLCTTIIESGLDIPSANTIIIDNAHLLGLAQLYQLKGRVGRSDIQAFAYFMYPKDNPLTEEAKERLSVIQDLNDLGSGYKVALRDMEIRGIGDVLGPYQHGNVLSVGYDTYCEILEEAINELRPEEEKTSNFLNTNTILDINISCYIPDNYIQDFRIKMQFYRRLAVIQDIDLLNDIKEELEDSYGKLPLSVENLLKVVKVKIFASKLNIKEIKANNKTIKIYFSIDNKEWYKIQSRNQDLLRWKWVRNEIETISTNNSENDLELVEKFLKVFIELSNKKELIEA